jgi:hypothetical protein
MRRPVCWTRRLEGGVKREVRVTFTGPGAIRWQAKRSDEESWVYDFTPSEEDWTALLHSLEARYRRRSAPWKALELVRRLAAER